MWYNEFMNPELPQVPRTPETPVQFSGGVEYGVEQPAAKPEKENLNGAEAQPGSAANQQYQGLPIALPVTEPVTPPKANSATSVADDDDTPLVASDDDLIEKEWVDKLKKIIALTRDDPYERNRVIAQLQADYLKKRYNKILGQEQENG